VQLHVYCVASSKTEGSLHELGVSDEVFTVKYKDLVALVRDAPERYEIIRDMKEHEYLIEKIMQERSVVPLRFNQQAKSREEVKGFLVKNHAFLVDLLTKLEGKVELNVKLFWKLEKALAELKEHDLRIRVLSKQIAELPEQRAYPLKIELGQIVEKGLTVMRGRILKEALAALKPLSTNVRENELLTREMIWNAAFLVNSSVEEDFDKAVNDLERKHGHLLAFRYVRSPPYTFTKLEIRG